MYCMGLCLEGGKGAVNHVANTSYVLTGVFDCKYIYPSLYLVLHRTVVNCEPELMALSKPLDGFRCSFTYSPLKCRVCNFILRDPQSVDCCKQNFCRGCIVKVKDNDGVCPHCSKDFVHYSNVQLASILDTSEVYCMYRCGWKGLLCEHDNHLNLYPDPKETWLDGCRDAKVSCIYCKNETTLRYLLLDRIKYTLSISKLDCVCSITVDIQNKWYDVGLVLELKTETLDSIKSRCTDPSACYHEMLKNWITTSSQPCWRKLLQALETTAVDHKKLAVTIERGI